MVSEKTQKTLEAMEKGIYINDRAIHLGGASYSARDVLVKAPLIARLNAYYVGGTGRGKTQLGNDLIGYFGDASCYAMGRPDFEPSELLKQVRLGNLDKVQTDRELVELTDNVHKNFFFIDEMNRAPPIVQNYFFDFFDGKIVHNGKVLNLGKEGYSIGFATGNLGDGEYVGVSASDRALKDRMHMIIKLDHTDYRPTPLNMLDIFKGKKNPRADMPYAGNSEVSVKDILEASAEFMDRETHLVLPFLAVYLTEGLDYLDKVKGNSKMNCDTRWPNLEGIATDNDENKILPLSPRNVLSSMALAGAFEMIAETKSLKADPVKLFLDSLRLTVPYSGVLSPAYVDQDHNGSVYSAFDSLLGVANNKNMDIREDVLSKVSKLEEAVALAEIGMTNADLLKDISSKKGRWSPVRKAIEGYAQRKAQNPDEETLKLKAIVEEAHKAQGGI